MTDTKGYKKVLAVLGVFVLLGLSGCGQEEVIGSRQQRAGDDGTDFRNCNTGIN